MLCKMEFFLLLARILAFYSFLMVGYNILPRVKARKLPLLYSSGKILPNLSCLLQSLGFCS